MNLSLFANVVQVQAAFAMDTAGRLLFRHLPAESSSQVQLLQAHKADHLGKTYKSFVHLTSSAAGLPQISLASSAHRHDISFSKHVTQNLL